jgi:hypothetical protein
MAQENILEERALDVLNRTDEIREILEYCGPDGGLTANIHEFVQSLEAPLRSQSAIDSWSREVEIEDSFIWLNLFPENWRISEGEFLAFGVAWCNPFDEAADDPYVFLRVPPADAFPARDAVLNRVRPELIAKGFEEYSPDQNPYWPMWKYLPLDSFQSPSGWDADRFVAGVVETFRLLLPCAAAIDQVLRSLPARPTPPAPSRP